MGEEVKRREEVPPFLYDKLQIKLSLVADSMVQTFPSIVTKLLPMFGENPVPEMMSLCPPKLPVLRDTAVIVGRTIKSKLTPDASEVLPM